MKAAGISEIKQELLNAQPKQVMELCLRLARFKKENKELLSYLLFDAHDQPGYIAVIKQEMEESFAEVHKYNPYLAKKTLRKILRSVSKYGKLMNSKQAEAELLIWFCLLVKQKGLQMHKTAALTNLYQQQIKKINNLLLTLHEDLRFDYLKQLDQL